MERFEVTQKLIDKKKYTTYLEIGVENGLSFLPIRCKTKIGVDPNFIIALKSKVKWYVLNPINFKNLYFEETSDAFFEKRKELLNNNKINISFIDGLHTFRQSLQDVLNVLEYLDGDGTIVVHDCNPVNEASSVYANSYEEAEKMKLEGWTGEWSGDVWKTIVYLRKTRDDLNVFVLDTDHGLGIITKKPNYSNQPIDEKVFEEVDKLTYEEFKPSREELINLKQKEYFTEFLHNN